MCSQRGVRAGQPWAGGRYAGVRAGKPEQSWGMGKVFFPNLKNCSFFLFSHVAFFFFNVLKNFAFGNFKFLDKF